MFINYDELTATLSELKEITAETMLDWVPAVEEVKDIATLPKKYNEKPGLMLCRISLDCPGLLFFKFSTRWAAIGPFAKSMAPDLDMKIKFATLEKRVSELEATTKQI
jgi:hypothetical protein